MDWIYKQPVEIIFGSNKIKELSEIFAEKSLKNGILVSDPFLVENSTAQKIVDYSKGLITTVYSDIKPNPTVDMVDECANLIKKNKIEFVVALGGGSCIDTAKAAASIVLEDYSIAEVLAGQKQLPKQSLPLIAIPTTAGTGSEVTPVSVLTDLKRNFKGPIASNNFYPDLAIIDPTLTISVPKKVTASTGMDVMAHALEGFWSKGHQPICDALALHAAKLVFKYLVRAYHDGNDLEAREKMSEASLIAGLAFGQPKTAASHACSYALTGIYHLPHGEACAFTLDSFVRINKDAEDGRVNNFAKQIGFIDADEMADRIRKIKKEMNLAVTLNDAGIKLAEIETLAVKSQHPNMKNNPVEMDTESLKELYKKLV